MGVAARLSDGGAQIRQRAFKLGQANGARACPPRRVAEKNPTAAARLAAGIAGYALDGAREEIIKDERRSAQVAFARQVAAYLSHIAYEWSLSRVASVFGRDRSTMAHACHMIEDRREEPQFDLWINALETMLREAPPQGVKL
jgi:hypothetical protein